MAGTLCGGRFRHAVVLIIHCRQSTSEEWQLFPIELWPHLSLFRPIPRVQSSAPVHRHCALAPLVDLLCLPRRSAHLVGLPRQRSPALASSLLTITACRFVHRSPQEFHHRAWRWATSIDHSRSLQEFQWLVHG
ncbi:hypothetical protein NE237_001370 [Protea cynaroides]|uniref:Uncharacterized protein n=1 Tax=Protea cynaroides TaxID=273540 RepID=A0A9Q0KTD0_9MAGN|nr:hypothetical protein NE237_001370 [Protea cynaroides]